MTTTTATHRRPRRTVLTIASAALTLGTLGVSSEIAAASERAPTDTRHTIVARGSAPTSAADMATRPGEPEAHLPGLHALAVYVQHCLDQMYPGTCAGGG